MIAWQLKHWKGDLHEGDVLVSNHPQLAGGSHLPDITVITPVFNEGQLSNTKAPVKAQWFSSDTLLTFYAYSLLNG